MKQNISLRHLFAFLVIFVMSLLLTLTCLWVVASLTLFDGSRLTQTLIEVDADTRSAALIKQEVIEIGLLYGVEADVFEGLDIEKYTRPITSTVYPGLISDNMDKYAELFEIDVLRNLKTYILTQGLTWTQEVEEGTVEMTKEVVSVFRKVAGLPLHQDYFNLIQTFDRLFTPVLLILLLILIVQQQILYRLDHRMHFRNLSFLFLTCGWKLVLIPGYLLMTRFYEQIMIYPDYFRDFLGRQIEVTLILTVWIGMMMVVPALIAFGLNMRKTKPQL